MILQRLIAIRWATIIAYLIVWMLGVGLIQADLWQPPILIIVLLLLLTNVILSFFCAPLIENFKNSQTRPSGIVVCTLLFDVILLSVFLYFYGGYTNPFSMMFLVYTCIAALLLSAMWTWIVFLISSLLYLCLFFFHITIPAFSDTGMHHHGHSSIVNDGFSVHLYGMLFSFLVTGSLITFFLTKMRQTLDLRQKQLLHFQQQALSSESMARVSALAAQSAHELSSPIATMTLVADSLLESDITESEKLNQISVLRKLIAQCREILVSIRERFQASADEESIRLSIAKVIQDITNRMKDLYPGQSVNIKSTLDLQNTFLCVPKTGLELTLLSIIDNAAKYGTTGVSGVDVEILSNNRGIEIEISNTCHDQSIVDKLNNLAAPFGFDYAKHEISNQSGLGIGIFLARQYLSSVQGMLSYQTRSDSKLTAIVLLPYAR